MKTLITLSIDYNLRKKLQEESNASLLVNSLLAEHYSVITGNKKMAEKAKEEKIIEETKEKMKEQEERGKIDQFLLNYDKKEYLEGVRGGKWKGVTEYARLKLSLNDEQKPQLQKRG